jgi:hypothetical protein
MRQSGREYLLPSDHIRWVARSARDRRCSCRDRATFSSLPREPLLQLGVTPERRVRLRLTDGRAHLPELGYVTVELDGEEGPTYVIFSEPGLPPSIGAITLEAFLLGVDPVAQRLVPVEGWQL